LKIDTSLSFNHLSHAPIVEAVIEIRAQASTQFTEETARSYLEKELTKYLYFDSLRLNTFQIEPREPSSPIKNNSEWQGIRFQSIDKRHLIQFKKDGFVFSELEPYSNWNDFSNEAIKAWELYSVFANPGEILRLGVRFINRINLESKEDTLESILRHPPQSQAEIDLPLAGFLNRSSLLVPGYSYAVNIITTIQPAQESAGGMPAIIIDIDVFTTESRPDFTTNTRKRLVEMRALKNAVFFNTVTENVIERLK
jgi:uncharacterized protein (TIGR04255 family)